MSDELRDQIAAQIGLRRQAAYDAERWFGMGSCADAVMEIVQPLVEQLRQAEVSRDAYRDERDAALTELVREREKFALADRTSTALDEEWSKADADCSELEESRFQWSEEARRAWAERDRLRLAWWSARRRANAWRAAATTEIPHWDEDAVVRRLGFLQPDQCGKCGEVNPRLTEALWLHAEAVWNWRHLADRYDHALERERVLRASADQSDVDRDALLDVLKLADADYSDGYRTTAYLAHLADRLIAAGYVCTPGHEWQCPGCGATTRARMADHPTASTP